MLCKAMIFFVCLNFLFEICCVDVVLLFCIVISNTYFDIFLPNLLVGFLCGGLSILPKFIEFVTLAYDAVYDMT